MYRTRVVLLGAVAVVLVLLLGCGGASLGPPGSDVQQGTMDRLPVKPVNAGDLRWLDISEFPYAESFRTGFDYSNADSYASAAWNDSAPTLSGTLTAVQLKPNFAYQMKLVGKANITSARTPPSAKTNPEGWASWQLGNSGRWWCATCGWNVADSDLASHLRRGHYVIGYLLFDFFVTDAGGNAVKPFALKSTYHVLWRADQRTRGANDSPILWQDLSRGNWGYGLDPAQPGPRVGVYAEWEPSRPKPGKVRLPAGIYPVWFNLTEESFHDNLGNTVPYGGFWAQVLEGGVTFRDTDNARLIAADMNRPRTFRGAP